MATDERSAKFTASLPGGAARSGQEREKILQELERQARRDALTGGGMLLELFRALPAAALAAERAEHERIAQRYGKEDPRAQALAASLDRLERAEARATLGRTRVARALQAAQMPGSALHGFVTDAAGAPLRGMTVRVDSPALRAPLAARSAADGYFRVELPPADELERAMKEEEERELARVSVLDANGRPVHEDPLALSLRAGVAYREYQVELEGSTVTPSAAAPRRGKRK